MPVVIPVVSAKYTVPTSASPSPVISPSSEVERLPISAGRTPARSAIDPALLLDGLVEAVSLVYLGFHKKDAGGVGHFRQIVGQLVAFILEKAAVLDENQPPVGEKGQGVRQTDNLRRDNILSLEAGKIHGIGRVTESPGQSVLILVAQISLFPAEQVGRLKIDP